MNRKNPPSKEKRPPVAIAVVGRKGGIGKTTTTCNVGAELASRGYQVLVVDLDLQGDATTALTREEFTTSTGDVLLAGSGLLDALVQTELPNLWLLPTEDELKLLVRDLVAQRPNDFRFALREVLKAEAGGFDFILIDCPPALDDIPLIGLCAADYYLTPAMPAYFSLKSLHKTGELTKAIQEQPGMNPHLKHLGTFFTDYNPKLRNNSNAAIVSAAQKLFPGNVLHHVRQDKQVRDAQRFAIPAQKAAPTSNAVADFGQLTDQLLERINS